MTPDDPALRTRPDAVVAFRDALWALGVDVSVSHIIEAVHNSGIAALAAAAEAAPLDEGRPPLDALTKAHDDGWMEGRKQGRDRERTLEQENDLLRRRLPAAEAAPLDERRDWRDISVIRAVERLAGLPTELDAGLVSRSEAADIIRAALAATSREGAP